MNDTPKAAALITGASSGIGAAYAERLAQRGHDLVLVARDAARMEATAARLRSETGIAIDVMAADLVDPRALGRVEDRLRQDTRIGILVNNAGAAMFGGFAGADPDDLDRLIRLNVTAVTRLARAAIPGMLARGAGAIVNLSSVLALAPDISPGIYAATKSFVLTFSQSLQAELGSRGIYVQAVLPAATRTEIFERAGRRLEDIQAIMEVGELVDAALAGFDQRESVTIPPLPDPALWDSLDGARRALLTGLRRDHPAARYRV